MQINLSPDQLRAIEAHGESTYPNEGAGFLLGSVLADSVLVAHLLPIANKREVEAQYNRYELSPQDFARAEMEADKRGMSLIGVFHSHPDHPARPSEFDRDHAWPNFAYLITSIQQGKAQITSAWRLRPDRSAFEEDTIQLTEVSG